jgi:hypothetical protein
VPGPRTLGPGRPSTNVSRPPRGPRQPVRGSSLAKSPSSPPPRRAPSDLPLDLGGAQVDRDLPEMRRSGLRVLDDRGGDEPRPRGLSDPDRASPFGQKMSKPRMSRPPRARHSVCKRWWSCRQYFDAQFPIGLPRHFLFRSALRHWPRGGGKVPGIDPKGISGFRNRQP